MAKRKNSFRPILLVCIFALLCVFFWSAYQVFFLPQNQGNEQPPVSQTVTHNGVDYYPRQDTTTFLLMGIDEFGPAVPCEFYNHAGAADMLAVLVLDHTNESYDVLVLNRDTMTEMPTLSLDGKPASTVTQQLALAHTYGNGLENSCENTRDAVSMLFGGAQIDYYVSIRMDAIPILTDAVGGVTLNVTEDFSAIDDTIASGTVHLNGKQALNYVRSRQNVGDELNTSRVDRHKNFVNAFLQSFATSFRADEQLVMKTFDDVAQYTVSDLSTKNLSAMVSRYSDYEFAGVTTLNGETEHPDGFMEFYPDKTQLDELIFSLFYAEKTR